MASDVTIRDVRTILTQPGRSRLIVVKVLTSEDGLYGVGCGTFTHRFQAVHAAIDKHVRPLVIGRDPSRIEDIWQTAMVGGYWRNGPVLNNAIGAVDMALWDIKGKRAHLPVYQLLGGPCRSAARVYRDARGAGCEEVEDNVRRLMAEGIRHVRVSFTGHGEYRDGSGRHKDAPAGAPPGWYFDRQESMRRTLRLLEHLRNRLGDEVELLLEVHERLHPTDALRFAKDVEPFRLFFLEDVLAPEDVEWFRLIRRQSATPLAMGELFTNPCEWQPIVRDRLIDFLRAHVSFIGGITPARNAAIFAAAFGVRTAWHNPGDFTPVGRAASLHLDLWAPNFGIHEFCPHPEAAYEIFPGAPRVHEGYLYPNDRPGLGVDVDEALAAKHPCRDGDDGWTEARLPDGSCARP